MKDDKFFDLGPILRGKDLIMTIKRMPPGDRRELAEDRLFAAGLVICDMAYSLAKDYDTDLKLTVKILRDALSDAKDAKRILEDLLKEVKEQ